MNKKIKKIFLIIAVVCFIVLFVSPRPSSAFAEEGETFDGGEYASEMIDTYLTYMQSNQNSLLSLYYTYNYLTLQNLYANETYSVNAVVSNIQTLSNGNYRYTVGAGSYYYKSSEYNLIPHSFSGYIVLNPVIGYISFLGNNYYFNVIEGNAASYNYKVVYCDLSTTFFSDFSNPSSLQHHLIDFNIPLHLGSLNSRQGNFGDNILSAKETAFPAPVTTLPPFIPPATLPPATLPPDIVTLYPPVTDLDGSYIIDYQPYIYGGFTPMTTLQDDTIITASGSIIAYSWDMLTADEQIKSIILLILVLSLVLGLLT